MSIAQLPPQQTVGHAWDWKSDTQFLEQLSQDLRRLAMTRIQTGVRAISVSSLVQESLVKLLDAKCLRHPEDRRYLYALAARAMRFVIVDHVRAQQAIKRRRSKVTTDMDLLSEAVESNNLDILAIHEALELLADRQPRQAQVVEMRFFAGCTMPEIAEQLGLGLSTVERDWTEAKKYLTNFLGR